MAIRHQEPQQLCFECRELTEEMCPRCRRSLCAEHMPGEGERCEPCEAEYEAILEKHAIAIRKSRPRWLGKILMGIAGFYMLMPLIVAKFPVGLSLIGLVVFGGATVVLHADHRLALRAARKARGRFLEERKVSLLAARTHTLE